MWATAPCHSQIWSPKVGTPEGPEPGPYPGDPGNDVPQPEDDPPTPSE